VNYWQNPDLDIATIFRMKRLIPSVLIGCLALSLNISPATAAIKPGGACKPVGKVVQTAGMNYTCVKSGKKFVWSKGQLVVKATPTPTSTPTSTQTPKALTFSNISENVDEIALNVFGKYQKLLATNYKSSIKVNTIIGPNTVPVNKNSASAYQIASKIFQNFKQPDEVFAIYYTFADKEWAKNQVELRAGKNIADLQFGYSCPNALRCWDASASVTLDWKAISHFGASDPGGAIHAAEMNGEIQIHEFTHSLSFFQLKPNRGNYYNLTPDWFAEGHASVAGKLGAATSFEQYTALRSEALQRNRPGADIQDYRPENILRFLESFMKYPEVSTIQRYYLYTLGWSTIEALAAIGGIDSPMNLYLETAKGLTFKQAFKKVYGIEWDTAAPILAEVVSKQYRTFYP
jgi:hypothetical protein